MKVKELQAEIEEALLRGLAIAQEFDPPCGLKKALTQDELEAWRTLTEDKAATAQELASTAPKTLALWVAKDVREGLGEE